VDTPPSRSALDFLDAPERLGSFLDGRLIRILSAPAKVGGMGAFKLLTGGVGLVTGALGKILGSTLLGEVQSFVAALDTMFGGFRERAERTYQLLQTEGTAFVVVAAPEPDALREASYFTRRLATDKMPLAGLVLNRVHRPQADITAERALAAAEELTNGKAAKRTTRKNGTGAASRRAVANDVAADGVAGNGAAANGAEATLSAAEEAQAAQLAAALLRLHAERVVQSRREHRLTGRFLASHPGIAMLELPAQAEDIHDLDGLREIIARSA
jgi:anion-transporting  ArsA/GET3 family ATPase